MCNIVSTSTSPPAVPRRPGPLWQDLLPDPRGYLLRQKHVAAGAQAASGSWWMVIKWVVLSSLNGESPILMILNGSLFEWCFHQRSKIRIENSGVLPSGICFGML